MGKTIFYYGVMASNKTLQLLTSAYNYKKKGTKYLIIKPSTDNRSGEDIVSSRIGLSSKADCVITGYTNDDLTILFSKIEEIKAEVILIDECQFLKPNLIKYLCQYATEHEIVLMAYGLLRNFQGKLFDGSLAWVENADAMREIKTECEKCNRKAIYNVRFVGETPVFDGDTVVIGDDNYHVFCAKHKNELEGKVKHIVKTN